VKKIILIDRLVGLPHKKVDPYESLWLNELQKYLVEDLRVDSSEQTNYEILCQKLKQIDPKSSKVKLVIPLISIKIMSIQLFFRLKFFLYSCINKNLMRLICIALKKIN